jgi:hypothetical protein
VFHHVQDACNDHLPGTFQPSAVPNNQGESYPPGTLKGRQSAEDYNSVADLFQSEVDQRAF